MWCGRENSSAVHGGNRCESTGVCRRGFVSRILSLPESGAIASFGIVPLGGFQTHFQKWKLTEIGKNSTVTPLRDTHLAREVEPCRLLLISSLPPEHFAFHHGCN